ncbi:aminotransferase class V-fold PLP-dependent enzyme [Desulfococcaceae bacterium HSG7]|nr:aminotransferase class V-fold PLP-dependent enzyme [Desulfococcaceae bacterium HSG7]
MKWQSVYDLYPVNQEFIWLNNCGTVPAGSHVIQAVTRFFNGYAQKGIFTETASYAQVRHKIKSVLANLLNCRPEELALIHHTSEGMNFISHGLDLQPEDEMILLENEYPSNVYPWLHWKQKGVKLRTVPMGNTPSEFMDGLTPLINSRTRLISLSAVHWCTGMPLPLNEIGALCHDKGITFVVDGAQGVGMQPIDVKRAHISYMAFPTWKWLMGPVGMGVLYVPLKNLERLKPVFIGSESVIQDEEYLPYKDQLKPTADRFTFSTANFNDWVYFLSALELLEKIGFDTVINRIFELSAYLAKGLTQIGYQVMAEQFSDHPTGIVVCVKPDTDSEKIMEHLNKNKIIAVLRLNRIRLAPHIFISEQQLDRVIDVMAR